MDLEQSLAIRPGLTAIIGGGGKTTLLYALAREASKHARVIVCTTTHIFPPAHLPCLTDGSVESVRQALEKTRCVCVGTKNELGKFSAPKILFSELLELAEYVFVEADGSKHRPLKAHADYEPVIPPEASQTILVLGVSGLGKLIREAAHRPELYAKKLGVTEDTIASPSLAAKLLNLEALHTRVLVNQVESEHEMALARELSQNLSCPVAAGALEKERIVCLC